MATGDEFCAAVRRVALVTTHTFAEGLRLRLLALTLLSAGGFLAALLGLKGLHLGMIELKFVADFGASAISLLGLLLAPLVTAQLWFAPFESGFASCVLAKAVRRSEYLLGTWVAAGLLLALVAGFLFSLLWLWLGLRAVELGGAIPPAAAFLQAFALLWLKLTLVAAMTLWVSSYARSALFASCLGCLLATVGHLRPLIGAGHTFWLRFWPDLARFTPDRLMESELSRMENLTALIGYWAACASLILLSATWIFRRREI